MLKDMLDGVRAGAALKPAVGEAVGATLAELKRTGVARRALAPGSNFPPFLLPDTEGRLVGLSDLLAGGPAVVTFFRGTWCPYCSATLDALREAMPEIEAVGGTLAAVTPETGGRALEAKLRHGASYRILADVDHGLAAACGVAFRVPEPYRRLLMAAGLNLTERQGNGAWLLPMPAAFVLRPSGKIAWAFVDPDFTRRAEPAEMIAVLHRIAVGARSSSEAAPRSFHRKNV